MTTTIALAGKGGVGKTTLTAMLIKYLCLARTQSGRSRGSILAIDADPSSNLNFVLGLESKLTVGDIREEMLNQVKGSLASGGATMGSLPGGISKRDYLEYQVHISMTEGPQYDLIAMGRSEGPGCYCAVNYNLRQVIDAISKNYSYVLIDNEAGMEHLSRRTTRDVQHLLVVSDPTQRGLAAASRIAAFRSEMDIHIEHTYLVLNRCSGAIPAGLQDMVNQMEIPLLGIVPADERVNQMDAEGRPLVEMDDSSAVYRAVAEMAK
jgi:CO dehydrogenase maturation factor